MLFGGFVRVTSARSGKLSSQEAWPVSNGQIRLASPGFLVTEYRAERAVNVLFLDYIYS